MPAAFPDGLVLVARDVFPWASRRGVGQKVGLALRRDLQVHLGAE